MDTNKNKSKKKMNNLFNPSGILPASPPTAFPPSYASSSRYTRTISFRDAVANHTGNASSSQGTVTTLELNSSDEDEPDFTMDLTQLAADQTIVGSSDGDGDGEGTRLIQYPTVEGILFFTFFLTLLPILIYIFT